MKKDFVELMKLSTEERNVKILALLLQLRDAERALEFYAASSWYEGFKARVYFARYGLDREFIGKDD